MDKTFQLYICRIGTKFDLPDPQVLLKINTQINGKNVSSILPYFYPYLEIQKKKELNQ